ncbi:hypothetical protein BH10PSE7_BH10PSE7_07810 [soil metagenome]
MPVYPSVIQLSELTATAGFRIGGALADEASGRSVSSAGDINGDGYDDLLIGAPNSAKGGATLIFGRAGGFGNLDLASLAPGDGFHIGGAGDGDLAGFAVAGAGDFNGDGFDDIIIGAPEADAPQSKAGLAYLLFGHAAGFGAVDLAALTPDDGILIQGAKGLAHMGRSVATAGDVNNDGYADILVGEPFGTDSAGRTYLIYGGATNPASFDVSSLPPGRGLIIQGAAAGDNSSYSTSAAGDVDGDGISDLIVGAPFAGGFAGSAFVVFGKALGSGTVNLGALGTGGFRIDGVAAYDQAGLTVSGAGDINGDGFDEIIVGAPFAAGGKGQAYVVFGKAAGFGTVDLAALGTAGFALTGGTDDNAGFSVASAGDVNGDGFDDLLIGAASANRSGIDSAGETYVVFGKAAGFGAVDLSALNGTNGFRIQGIAELDQSGFSVSSADVNGDGFSDIVIAAPFADGTAGEDSGETYVIFGIKPTTAVSRTGTGAGQTLAGGLSKDTLAGLGGDDRLFGNQGNDTLNGGTGADRMIGGTGNDTYYTDVKSDSLIEKSKSGADTVIASYDYTLKANFENLTLAGAAITGTGNSLLNRLTGNELANRLLGKGGNDIIAGGNGNDSLIGGAGNDRLTGGDGQDKFIFYTASESRASAKGDTIADFDAGTAASAIDIIDLHLLDANTTAVRNQAFKFIGESGFTAGVAGQLRLDAANGVTIILADTNGDAAADFRITLGSLIDPAKITALDFLL